MGILEIILTALLLIALPLGQFFPIEVGSARMSWLDGGILLLLVSALFFWKKKKIFLSIGKPFGIFSAIALFSLVMALPTVSFSEWIASALYLLRWIAYFLVIIPIASTNSQFKKHMPILLFASSMVIAGGGFLQYFLFPSLRGLTYEGWDPHLYRMFGTFFDPNFLGSYLVVSFLLGIELFFHQTTKVNKYIFGLGNLLLLIGVFLTFSRSSYIALFIGVGCYLFFKGYKKWIFAVLLSLILFGGVVFGFSFRQNEGTNLLRSASTAARIGNMERSIQIIVDNPFVGIGFNTYRYAQHKKGFIGGMGWETSHSGAGVNNSYLFVMATTGIVGLLAFLYLLYRMVVLGRTTKSVYGVVLLAGICAIGVNSLFENTFFYEAILFWLWVMVGVIENT